MSIRNLEYLFEPRSVALIGASRSPGSVEPQPRLMFSPSGETPIRCCSMPLKSSRGTYSASVSCSQGRGGDRCSLPATTCSLKKV